MAIILGGVLEETRPVRSVIPQTDISSIDGQKSWAGLTRVNWINAFLPTMRRPFTGNNMKICRIKSVWRARRDQVLGGHGVLSNKGLWGFEDIEEGQCYIHILSLKAYSCRDILWTVYQIQSEWWCSPPTPFSRSCQWTLWLPYIAITWWPSLIVITHRGPVNPCSQAVWGLD